VIDVPVVVALRTSSSPVKVPPVIETVALAKVVLFKSDTVRFGESVTAAPPFVKESVAATEDSVGGAAVKDTSATLIIVPEGFTEFANWGNLAGL